MMQHPVIEEFYRSGTKAGKDRKCFVRIRVPPLQDGKIPLEWDVSAQSHSTYKTDSSTLDAPPCTLGEEVCNALKNNPAAAAQMAQVAPVELKTQSENRQGVDVFLARLVQGEFSHVLLVADETGDWGTKSGCTKSNTECSVLQFASDKNTKVLPAPLLIEIVDQTFPEINRKIDINNDLTAAKDLADTQLFDESQYKCSAELGERVTHYAYEGAPGKKFATRKECTENAKTYKQALKEGDEDVTAMDEAIFTCIKNSDRPTLYRFKAESILHTTEADCKQAAADALSARNEQLKSDKSTAEGATMETFTEAEKKDYGMDPIVRVVQRGSKEIWSHINTVKSDIINWSDNWSDADKVQALKDNGMTMTPLEKSVFLGSSPIGSEQRLVDGVRVSFPGDLWLVRNNNAPSKLDFAPTDATWCVNQPKKNGNIASRADAVRDHGEYAWRVPRHVRPRAL